MNTVFNLEQLQVEDIWSSFSKGTTAQSAKD